MHCLRCGYLLFNLTRPECPECGERYDAERYRFAPGAVSFHCPHCDQPYYGNDPQGLPWPREFACAECGRQIRLQEMRVVPQIPDAVGWSGSVWDNRKRIGFWRAWWQAAGAIVLRPSQFFRNHVGTSTFEAWLFSTVSLYIGLLPAMLMQSVLMWGLTAMMVAAGPGGGAAAFPIPLWVMVLVMGMMGLVLPFFVQLVVGGVWTLAIQFALLFLAPNRRPIEATFRTMLYSFGTFALHAVPICGSQVAGIWHIVTLIVGIKEVHGIGGGKATVAVLWPIVASIAAYIAFVMILISAAT